MSKFSQAHQKYWVRQFLLFFANRKLNKFPVF